MRGPLASIDLWCIFFSSLLFFPLLELLAKGDLGGACTLTQSASGE